MMSLLGNTTMPAVDMGVWLLIIGSLIIINFFVRPPAAQQQEETGELGTKIRPYPSLYDFGLAATEYASAQNQQQPQ